MQEDSPNVQAKNIDRWIKNACEKHIPKNKLTRPSQNQWWGIHLDRIKSKVRKCLKRYRVEKNDIRKAELHEQYKWRLKEYRTAIKQSKTRNWDKFLGEAMADTPWNLPYRICAGKFRRPQVLATVKRPDGTITEDWEETAEILLENLLPGDEPERDTMEDQELRRLSQSKRQEPMSGEVYQITEAELAEIIDDCKKGKAPGPDRIQVDFYQATKEEVIPYLTKCINNCIRKGVFPNIHKDALVAVLYKGGGKDPMSPASYRPIGLLNSAGKIIEKVIAKQLSKHLEDGNLEPNQYGFRKKKSTEKAVRKVIKYIRNSKSKYVAGIFIDISGAFNNLWWPLVVLEMERMKVPKYLQKILQDYCHKTFAHMQDGKNCKRKNITKGRPQGSILGPILWNLILDSLLKMLYKY